MTSVLSWSSLTRSATRRLVFARMWSSTTPLGRCVASTRWIPRLRPRWAMSTTPSTNSGTSRFKNANSSKTMSRFGGAVAASLRFELDEILRRRRPQDLLAAAQLGVQRHQGALGEVRVEVGEEPDGVRQRGAVLERGAALVVDEHERETVRWCRRRERPDQRLEELALARAGRARDRARAGRRYADRRVNGPRAPAPTDAAKPRARDQRSTMRSGEGGSRSRRSRSATVCGTVFARSAAPASRTHASARAVSSARPRSARSATTGETSNPVAVTVSLRLTRDRPDAHDLAALARQVGRCRRDNDRAHAGRHAARPGGATTPRGRCSTAPATTTSTCGSGGVVAEKAMPTFTRRRVARPPRRADRAARASSRSVAATAPRYSVPSSFVECGSQCAQLHRCARAGSREDRDHQVTRAVQRARLHDEPARDRFGRVRVADDPDHVARTEIDGDRHERVGGELRAQARRPGATSVVVAARRGVDRDLARSVGRADAEREEVGVGGAPFPEIGRDALARVRRGPRGADGSCAAPARGRHAARSASSPTASSSRS